MMWWLRGCGLGSGYGTGFGGGLNSIWGVLGALAGLLFLALIAVLAFFAIRALLRSAGRPGYAGGAVTAGPAVGGTLAVLRERYARGELTKEQFDQMRQDLGV